MRNDELSYDLTIALGAARELARRGQRSNCPALEIRSIHEHQ